MEKGAKKLGKVDRDNFLIKLEKELAFSGATIPDDILIEGERVRLRSVVFEVSKRRGMLSQEELSDIERLTSKVARTRKETISRIRAEDLTYDEADELYRLAMGLKRALDTLYMASEPKASVQDAMKNAKAEDGKRWLNLVKKVYTREENRRQKLE